MVQDAQGSKAPIQRVVDAVSAYFVPAVMILALLAGVIWYDFGPEPRAVYAVIVMVTTLIIACPCALGWQHRPRSPSASAKAPKMAS